MTNLFISYYKAATPERQAEIDYCLKKNCESGLFNKVIALISADPYPNMDKWYNDREFLLKTNFILNNVLYDHKGNPTYHDFIDTINDNFNIYKHNTENSVNIIANADIIFDETLSHIDKLKEDDCWALSRWEMKSDYTKHIPQIQIYGDSQDVWIFRGKIKPIGKADFPLGKMGCDNRIAYEIAKAGYNISNPSKTIHTWHLHNSGVRGYNPQVRNEHTVVPEPYLNVPVIAL